MTLNVFIFLGGASEGASPGPVRRRVSDKSGVAIAGGKISRIIFVRNNAMPFQIVFVTEDNINDFSCISKGLPYMLERAGLDVQQGNAII